MCYHGTYKYVEVINPNQSSNLVAVDACIADELRELNVKGVTTLGCCCGHGKAGQIVEYENGFGKWKTYYDPPMALISEGSVELAKSLGYRPYPYYYADGEYKGVWQMHLKSGCVTEKDCEDWRNKTESTS